VSKDSKLESRKAGKPKRLTTRVTQLGVTTTQKTVIAYRFRASRLSSFQAFKLSSFQALRLSSAKKIHRAGV
jgi:hypothetical protein